MAGRVGGDEFMVFMHNIREAGDACTLAQKVEDLVMHAFDGDPMEGMISMSIGIAMCPAHGGDFETLYKHADEALYYTKEHGKAGWHLYDPDDAVKGG